jgi:AraC-like DNA-binding protein
MQLVLDRDPAAFARARTRASPSLIFPLEATVIELEAAGLRAQRIDRGRFALLPARVRARVISRSPAPKVVTLILDGAERARMLRAYAEHVTAATFDRVLCEARLLPRTRWVDELVHRYLFERAVCQRHDSEAARFCETELVKELYFLGAEQLDRHTRANVTHQGSSLVERARAHIEAELFAPLSTAALARACHASESALLRAFRRELGVAPTAYARQRRLDEALLLLESGRYSVGEVAERVGYRGQAAFAAAFHKKFRQAPSRVVRESRHR